MRCVTVHKMPMCIATHHKSYSCCSTVYLFNRLLLTVILLALAACATLVPHEYLVTHAKLEEKLERSFPIHRELGQGLFSTTIDVPELGFDAAQNRISLTSGFSVHSFLSNDMRGRFVMTFALRYDAIQHAIFLQDTRLESLKIEPDNTYAGVLRAALDRVLDAYLTENPLYRFRSDELHFAGTDIEITGIEVATDGIRLKLAPKPQPH